jgi:outer membrane lipoprotein-sorting protein
MNIKMGILKTYFLVYLFLFAQVGVSHAQEPSVLMKEIQARLEKINDYEADARMKTEITFLKVPDAGVKIYYKKPDKIKIKNQNGISLVPKETMSISLYSLVKSPYQALDAGIDRIQGIPVRVIKLLPSDENADLVLATLYIDISRLLILKGKITTRENGTDEVELFYGKFLPFGLPDKIIFSFNTENFKLPKGVTFDYDDGSVKKKVVETGKSQRGKIEITYLNYTLNKGLADSLFK